MSSARHFLIGNAGKNSKGVETDFDSNGGRVENSARSASEAVCYSVIRQ